jgi:uncharacterized protein (TIGR03067 family)
VRSSLGADDPKEKGTDLDKLQGSWKALKANMDGMDATAEILKEFDIVIKGDQATPAGNPTDVATLKIDAAKKPAEIDFIDRNKKVDRGIYRFVDQDTLEICLAEMGGNERPKEFAAAKDSKCDLLTLKRSK